MKKLFVVGIGPGGREDMTFRADACLKGSEVIVGYTLYVDLVKEYYPEAVFLTTGMRQEKDRCLLALREAEQGKATSVICSGDSGIYGMAGLILQLSGEFPEVEIEVIPGITAGFAAGALLGAPLTNDVCLISLSDLLTPPEVIEKRLRAAAKGDFVICLYNPASRTRTEALQKACGILLETRDPQTVCALVRNISREGQSVRMLPLKELKDTAADMLSLIVIGNSSTYEEKGKMITPRGYRNV